jgi:hypothetical protein
MAKTWRRLPAKTRLRRVDEQANSVDMNEDVNFCRQILPEFHKQKLPFCVKHDVQKVLR